MRCVGAEPSIGVELVRVLTPELLGVVVAVQVGPTGPDRHLC